MRAGGSDADGLGRRSSIDGGLGGSGVLDVAREVQLRIKHWGYAYQMTNDTKWVDRCWLEVLVRRFLSSAMRPADLVVQTAAGNSTTGQYFGKTGDNWNARAEVPLLEPARAHSSPPVHFLDLAEFTVAFAMAYDWSVLTSRAECLRSHLRPGPGSTTPGRPSRRTRSCGPSSTWDSHTATTRTMTQRAPAPTLRGGPA